VNQAGGLKLKSGQRKVELIEYDDHTQPPEAIKAIERLASIDKADWVVGLYSTGFNVAAVPTFAKLGYPQLAVACVTDLGPQLVKKNPRLFFANGTTTQYSSAVVDVLKKLQSSGRMGNKIAMVNVADEYGIESANISRKLFPAAGFELVYDKSYPLGTQDYAPVIKAAKAANPDAFIAYSYPPDTFGLTDQAKIENFNVKAYYNGIGCAFAGFAGKYGAAAENVIGFGGVPDNDKTRAFLKLHKEVTGLFLPVRKRRSPHPSVRRRRHGRSRGGHRLPQKPHVQNRDRRDRLAHSVAKHRLYRRAMAEWLLPVSFGRWRCRFRTRPCASEGWLGVKNAAGLKSDHRAR
jgi:branched-chain amino acid transport system substrate-binding protein